MRRGRVRLLFRIETLGKLRDARGDRADSGTSCFRFLTRSFMIDEVNLILEGDTAKGAYGVDPGAPAVVIMYRGALLPDSADLAWKDSCIRIPGRARRRRVDLPGGGRPVLRRARAGIVRGSAVERLVVVYWVVTM